MSETGKILVTGATGSNGGAVMQNLIGRGANFRALVHDETKAQAITDTGVEVVTADYLQPETLDAAFEGIDKVFLVTPWDPDAAKMASNAIAAAKRSGNPHIVRLSEASPPPVNELRGGVLHVEIDAELQASGLPYTLLRPTYYMQNTMGAAQSVSSDGMIYMPFKDGKLGMIDMRDVAETATKLLTEDGHEGKTYVLTGPASIGLDDVANELSKALGKEVKYLNVPLDAARESIIGMGMPEWTAEMFCEYMDNHSKGVSDYTTNEVEELTGHVPIAYETFASDFASYFGGN